MKLIRESLNDVPIPGGSRDHKGGYRDYSRLEKQDKLDVLEPLGTALRGALANPEWFDVDLIDQITDLHFAINKEIGRNS